MTREEAKTFLNDLKVCIEEHPIVADWLIEIANRKTESQTITMVKDHGRKQALEMINLYHELKTKLQTYYKKWDAPPKVATKGINTNCVVIPACLLKNERCAECRNWSYGKDICNLHDMGMMAEDYCSYWERK